MLMIKHSASVIAVGDVEGGHLCNELGEIRGGGEGAERMKDSTPTCFLELGIDIHNRFGHYGWTKSTLGQRGT